MKCGVLNLIQRKLLIDAVDTLLPIITTIVNASLRQGNLPSCWKSAVVLPLLEKPGLEPCFDKFRPESNLQFISKIVDSAVALQLQSHLSLNGLYPVFQSAYRRHYSTETALLKFKNDLLMAMNKQQVTLPVLLDLSSAFDTLNHDTLLNVLRSKFGIEGTALHWFDSYLSNIT